MISDRELFLPLVYNLPNIMVDAIVVLCGEDGRERAKSAVELFKIGASENIVLSGGAEGNGKYSAKSCWDTVVSGGVSPERIILEEESTNTHEQAENVIELALERRWKYLTLVASPYHAPRAYLTFLKTLLSKEKEKEIRLLSRAPSHLKWFEKPEGSKYTRANLVNGELGKIALYPEHVATYAEGIGYLKYWEAA